ncbi:MAG: hypothetical protein LBL06_03245 [Treponema sp.]|nr:hypothetical protein [Treponema sp.]
MSGTAPSCARLAACGGCQTRRGRCQTCDRPCGRQCPALVRGGHLP